MSQGLIGQLTDWIHAVYPLHSPEAIQQHLLEVMERKTYLVEVDGDQVVGYAEWAWPLGSTTTLHVLELLARRPDILWKLKGKLDQLPWTFVYFRRQKTGRWRHYRRVPIHV